MNLFFNYLNYNIMLNILFVPSAINFQSLLKLFTWTKLFFDVFYYNFNDHMEFFLFLDVRVLLSDDTLLKEEASGWVLTSTIVNHLFGLTPFIGIV